MAYSLWSFALWQQIVSGSEARGLTDGQPAFCIQFGPFRAQKRNESVNPFGVTAAAAKSLCSNDSGSDSDFATVFIPQRTVRKRPGRSLVFRDTSMAALLQASEPYFRLNGCKSDDLVHATSFDPSAAVLGRAAQLVFTDPPYSLATGEVQKLCTRHPVSQKHEEQRRAQRRLAAARFACDSLLHCPAAGYLTHLLLSAKVHAGRRLALVICVDIKGYVYVEHCFLNICRRPLVLLQNPAKKSCAHTTAVKFALRSRKNGLLLATNEKRVNYKQVRFGWFAFRA